MAASETATAAAHEPAIDALGQFTLHPVLGAFGRALHFTNANLLMLVGAGLVLFVLQYGARARAIVPGRLQAAAELGHQFAYNMAVEQIGPEGRAFFPFIFTLFFFILMGNLLGLIPFSFTYTSHIVVTFAAAALVILLATGVALRRHGLHFFSYFLPQGTPIFLAPLIVPIEIISYLSRPVSLSVRLAANMLAGHVVLAVFATFIVMLGGASIVGALGAVLPLAMTVALTAFELLVAALQAYVFAMLTCIYLHDAVHLH